MVRWGYAGHTDFVFLALPPTWGKSRSTPKGAFLSWRNPFNSAICSRSMSGVYPTPPMTPMPPASLTAAASFGPAATFMPASMMGWLILRRPVVVVRICSAHGIHYQHTAPFRGPWYFWECGGEDSLRGEADAMAAVIAVAIRCAIL
jgi:hypothetical protein